MSNTTNTKQLDKLIELRATKLAEQMAEVKVAEFKKDFLTKFNLDSSYVNAVDVEQSKKKASSKTVFTEDYIKNLNNDSKLKQVYDIFKTGGRYDRHSLADMMQEINSNEVSYGTICGRIGDLLNAGIIIEKGYQIGKFGKKVAVYGIKG